MSTRDDSSFLESALHYASQEARAYVADSLACYLHNDGYALEGNTEANDVGWFARTLWADDTDSLSADWDRAGEPTQRGYLRLAQSVLRVLPNFQLRVAHRLITLSKVVRDIERAEREQRSALKSARRGPGERP
jgi:hypothetical protein